MTAAELRINNWVTYNPESVDEGTEIIPLNVEEILSGGVRLNDGFDNTYYFDEILPIPLSPELLRAIGFEKRLLGDDICFALPFSRKYAGKEKKHDILLVDYGVVDTDYSQKYAFAIREYDRDIQFGITIVEYLHELQNLFYSLTGEELSIDLNNVP